MVDSTLKRCVWGSSNREVPLELVFLKLIAHKLKVGTWNPLLDIPPRAAQSSSDSGLFGVRARPAESIQRRPCDVRDAAGKGACRQPRRTA